jgi:hypothetical protein
VLAEAIAKAVPAPVTVANAPDWLRAATDYQLLAEEIQRLLDR